MEIKHEIKRREKKQFFDSGKFIESNLSFTDSHRGALDIMIYFAE